MKFNDCVAIVSLKDKKVELVNKNQQTITLYEDDLFAIVDALMADEQPPEPVPEGGLEAPRFTIPVPQGRTVRAEQDLPRTRPHEEAVRRMQTFQEYLEDTPQTDDNGERL